MLGRALGVAVALAAAGTVTSRAAAAAEDSPDTMGKPKHSGPGYLTWVGFSKTDGGARVFVRLSSPPGPNLGQARGTGELVVTLPGYRLDVKNDGRALDTRYFGTDVVRVVATPVKNGVELHVQFKKDGADARVTTGSAPDGETLVYLDF